MPRRRCLRLAKCGKSEICRSHLLFLFYFTTLLGLLLTEAVETAESPDDVGAVDADDLAVGKTLFEDISGTSVVDALVGWEDDFAVGDVEVGVGGWQTLVFVNHHIRHGQFNNGGLFAICQATLFQKLEVLLQGFVVLVPFVFLNGGDDGVGVDKSRKVVNMSVGVVAHNAVAQPDDVIYTVEVAEVFFNLLLVELRIAVGVEQAGLGGEQVSYPIDIDAAAFHNDVGREAFHVEVISNMDGNLGVEFVRIFATPCVVVPIDEGSFGCVLSVEQEGWTMVATPSVVGWELVEDDMLHVRSIGGQRLGDMLLHCRIFDIDMYHFRLREHLDEKVVGRENGLNLARPRVFVVRIGQPCGTMFCPFGGHIKTKLLGSGHGELRIEN